MLVQAGFNKNLLWFFSCPFCYFRCVRKYEGHSNRSHPLGVAWSPCSKYFAVGSEDKSVRAYDNCSTAYYRLHSHFLFYYFLGFFFHFLFLSLPCYLSTLFQNYILLRFYRPPFPASFILVLEPPLPALSVTTRPPWSNFFFSKPSFIDIQ